jgi:hypothetical protein
MNGINMKNIILIAIAVLLMVSCSSTKKVSSDLGVDKDKLNGLPIKTEIQNLTIKCKLNVDYKSSKNSANAVIKLAGYDSVSIMITGPLSIPVGKLYANKDYFVFYNTLQNEVLEGKPTARNLERAIFLPLDFDDLVKLLRAEPTQIPTSYKPGETKSDYLTMSTKIDNNKREIVYLEKDSKKMKVLEWEQKADKLILVEYNRYRSHSGQSLPNLQIYSFPEIDAQVEIDVSKYIVNEAYEDAFSFEIPDGVKRFSLD